LASPTLLRLSIVIGALVAGCGSWLRWAPRFVQDEEVEVAAAVAVAITCCGALAWAVRPRQASWLRWGLAPAAWLIAAGVFLAANAGAPTARFELMGPVLELAGGMCLLTGLLEAGCARGLKPRLRPRPGPKTSVRGANGRSRKAAELVAGDRILLRADAPLPVDVRLRAGQGFVDTSEVDGHGAPMSVGPGSELMAGSVPKGGELEAEVLADHGHSFQTIRARTLESLLPELGVLEPEDRALAFALWVLALGMGIGVVILTAKTWDQVALAVGASWLAVLPGLAFLAVNRGREATLRSFLRLGVIGGSSAALLALVRARRWLVDPMLVSSAGELEVIALGNLPPSEGARWAAALYESVDGLEGPVLRRWLEKAELEVPSVDGVQEVDGVRRCKVEGHQVLAGRLGALAQLGLELPSAHQKALDFLRARRMLVVAVATEGRGLQFLLGIKPLAVDDVVRASRTLGASLMPVLDDEAMEALSGATELPKSKREARAQDATLLRQSGPRPAVGQRIRVVEGRLFRVPPGRAPIVGRRVLPTWAEHLGGARRQLRFQRWLGLSTVVVSGLVSLSLAYAGLLYPWVAVVVGVVALSLCGSQVTIAPIRSSNER
jgi:hypothetical protein